MCEMRGFSVLLACLATVLVRPAADGSGLRPRTLQRLISLGAEASPQPPALNTTDCRGQQFSCVGCKSRLRCAKVGGSYHPVEIVSCTSDTPYCTAGRCVVIPEDACVSPPQPSPGFTCTGDGYYPDPASCRRYFMCARGSAYQYDCSSSSVFSYARAMCVPSSEAPCVTASCAAAGTHHLYPPAREVYFLCRDTRPANALVGVCPDNHTVDPATQDCRLTCLGQGRLPDRENVTRYYECSRAGNGGYSAPVPQVCPAGSTFSPTKQRCLTGDEGTVDDGEDEAYHEDYFAEDRNIPESDYRVASTLKIGAASSAYQTEGAWNYSDKALSEQDVYYHMRPTLENGDNAAKSYFKYKEDVELLKELKLNHYRFSLSWARLFPHGNTSHSKTGLKHYNDVINALLAAGIEPVVTLYHWDMPVGFQNDGGWLNRAIQERFESYARFCFKNFGDRVRTWVLVNEPQVHCMYGYDDGSMAPGVALPGVGAYICNHNMVLAHAKAYRAYQRDFKHQGGKVGSAVNMDFSEPRTSSKADRDAAERYAVWQYAWFVDPLYTGDYPPVMRQIVDTLSAAEGRADSRLPRFSDEEKTALRGAWDFLGLNNYRSVRVEAPPAGTKPPKQPSYITDCQVLTSYGPKWIKSARDGFPVTPWGLAGCVKWIRDRYNSPPIWIFENGYAGSEQDGTADHKRIGYYSGNMRGLMRAINKEKCNVVGYTAWSLLDSLEWNAGYASKFGLVHVDYDKEDRPRTIKDSGLFFKTVMETKHVPYVPAS